VNRPVRNIPESVKQRLINIARARDVPVNEVLQFYAMERFLYRLGNSLHRDRFLLKGALLLQAWRLAESRTTRDIDLLGKTGNSLDNVARMIAEVCALNYAHEDGMVYNADTIQAVRIKEDAEYEGVRVVFNAHLGSARLPMQIDIGFNDVVTPQPQTIEYPPLLDSPAPTLMGYTPETVIAEKVEAMIVLDVLNSRMKDFFDVWLLSRHLAFRFDALALAIRNTLDRPGTCHDPVFCRRLVCGIAPRVRNRIDLLLAPPLWGGHRGGKSAKILRLVPFAVLRQIYSFVRINEDDVVQGWRTHFALCLRRCIAPKSV